MRNLLYSLTFDMTRAVDDPAPMRRLVWDTMMTLGQECCVAEWREMNQAWRVEDARNARKKMGQVQNKAGDKRAGGAGDSGGGAGITGAVDVGAGDTGAPEIGTGVTGRAGDTGPSDTGIGYPWLRRRRRTNTNDDEEGPE